MNALCAAAQGIDGEAARIAEHIEDAAAVGVLLEEAAVVALVHEESRLLSAQPVNVEFQPVLNGHIFGVAADEEPVFLSEVSLEG